MPPHDLTFAGRERDRVAVGVSDCRDALSIRHVLGLLQDGYGRVGELAEHPVEIGDVDIHLEPGTVADQQPEALGCPPTVDDRQLATSIGTPQPDVAGLAVLGLLDVSVEAQQLPERTDPGTLAALLLNPDGLEDAIADGSVHVEGDRSALRRLIRVAA